MTNALDLTKVYNQFSKQVFSYLNFAIGNLHDAEEVCNDVFIKIMRLQTNPDTQFNADLSALPTYVRTVTESVLKDYFRTNHQDKYKAVSDFSDKDGNPFFEFKSPEKADKLMERKEVKQRITDAINGLKPSYRRVAVLRFEKELKYDEIASELGWEVGRVKITVNRCKKLLKAELNDLHKVRKTEKQTEKAEA